ncbi:hypothetical protein PFNF54_00615 [Plasmodium falciparum NF54]|uniref:Stevor n=1 Tax=Plasmodium falciparum (isolate NF54) TaxID=5843 RepID=W7JZX6_PLAFO|nr:hypothetical protein PFNF54_00615 [Plasmodium falciparum NF54]
MNTYYVKLLLFTFLINILVLPHNENYINNHYNIILIQNNTQRTTIKSRLLAQTQNHNPHYHNDPELKEMIDKLNEEAIKKYQQTHEPYEQLKELVEKSETKLTGGNDAEPMSTLEKELLEIYEEMFGHKNDIMLKSCMYQNDDEKSDKSSSCLLVAKAAAVDAFKIVTASIATCSKCASSITISNMFNNASIVAALQKCGVLVATNGVSDGVGTAVGTATTAFNPYGIAALVLILVAVALIILYIWLYRRRKNSWKHECKKHLCK